MRLSRLIVVVVVALVLFPLLRMGPGRHPSQSPRGRDASSLRPLAQTARSPLPESAPARAQTVPTDRFASTNTGAPPTAPGLAPESYGNATLQEAREQVERATGRTTRLALYKTQGK